jgi:hypothetical protein
MPFDDATRVLVRQLPRRDKTRLVLEFLLEHGVGRDNAQLWSNIEDHLNAHGISMTQTHFQQTILKETTSGNIFIGSNDHGARGYFLIRDREDAEMAREFYTRRVAAEQANLNHLESLIRRQRWP